MDAVSGRESPGLHAATGGQNELSFFRPLSFRWTTRPWRESSRRRRLGQSTWPGELPAAATGAHTGASHRLPQVSVGQFAQRPLLRAVWRRVRQHRHRLPQMRRRGRWPRQVLPLLRSGEGLSSHDRQIARTDQSTDEMHDIIAPTAGSDIAESDVLSLTSGLSVRLGAGLRRGLCARVQV